MPAIHIPFPSDLTPAQAVRLQETLRRKTVIAPLDLNRIHTVGGVDVGVRGEHARAAVTVFSFPDLRLLGQATADSRVEFPYIPGLLSFREIPAILTVLTELETLPDVLICDGQGLAHPRRFGLACHLGVLLDCPAAGCAKSILVGKHEPLAAERGGAAPLVHAGEVVGQAVRTRDGVKPVYVSPGHRLDVATATDLVLACGKGYRLPEPTRWADKLTKIK